MTTVLHHEIVFYFTFVWPLTFVLSLLTAPHHARSWKYILLLFFTGPFGTLYCLSRPFLYPEKKHFEDSNLSGSSLEEGNGRQGWRSRALPVLLTLSCVLLLTTGGAIFFHKGWTKPYYILVKSHSLIGHVSFLLFSIYVYLHLNCHANWKAAVSAWCSLFLLFALVFTLNQINLRYLLSFVLIFLIVVLLRFAEKRIIKPVPGEVNRSGFGLFFIMVMAYYTGMYLAEPVNSRWTNSMALYILYIHGSIACLLIPLMFSFIQIHRSRALPGWFPFARRLSLPAYALLIVLFYPYAHQKWSGDKIEWRPIQTMHPTNPSLKPASAESFVPPSYHWTLDEFTVCASSRCHDSLVLQWETSSHRFSADNKIFKKVVELEAKERGREAIRSCQNCHDPVGAFMADRKKATDRSRWGKSLGVTCKVCHSIQKVAEDSSDGVFWLRHEIPYPVSLSSARWRTEWASYIRWDLRLHFKNYSNPPLYQSPDYCVACHRVTGEIDGKKVVRHDVFDAWKASPYAKKNIRCRACHMDEFERNPRGILFPDHRFPGLNQALSLTADSPFMNKSGIHEFEKFTAAWVKGRVSRKSPFGNQTFVGPILSLQVKSPSRIKRGRVLPVVFKTKNMRVGHDFPIGFKDLVEAWLEVKAVDGKGNVIFHSGFLKNDRTVDPDAHILGAAKVWKGGPPAHLTQPVPLKRRLIPPRKIVSDYFFIPVPEHASSPMTIYAKWNYRRLRQEYVGWFFTDKRTTFPVTEIVSVKEIVPVF